MSRKQIVVLAAWWLGWACAGWGEAVAPFRIVPLPPLQIAGQASRAHTQGLELVAGDYYVSARQEDGYPPRALLLRTRPSRSDWDSWDLTPVTAAGALTALNHPGGMQSDGQRLWVPLAENRPKSQSRIRAYSLAKLTTSLPVQWELDFAVEDHIGALAVSIEHQCLIGANWDTETIYVWNLAGELRRKLTGRDLQLRELGVHRDSAIPSGLTIQDWKFVGDRLYASGLFKELRPSASLPLSRWATYSHFLRSPTELVVSFLPQCDFSELGREGMAITGGQVYFLPEDLGPTNRIFTTEVETMKLFWRPPSTKP